MQPPLDKLPLKKFREHLFLPDFEKSICGIMPTAFELLNIPVPTRSERYAFSTFKEGQKAIAQNIRDFSDSPRHVINVLIDSWGGDTLSSSFNNAIDKLFFSLRGFLLSSVFPTITSSAVTSWHMGVPPNVHGILGHKILFEEIGSVVNTLELRTVTGQGGRDSLVRAGIRPEAWLWCPSLYNELEGGSVIHVELLSRGFAGTGMSHFFLGKKPTTFIVGCNDLIDIFATARELLVRAKQRQNLLINIYLGGLDWLIHKFGPHSPEGAEELNHIAAAIKWFLFSLPEAILKDTVLCLSADHGQVDTTRAAPVLFTQSQQDFLVKNLLSTIPGRSGRLMHLYVKPGKEDDLMTYLTEIVDTRGVVLPVDDAYSLLNVSTISKRTRSRLGNILILLKPGTQFTYEFTPDDSDPFNDLDTLVDFPKKGSHGSISFQELVVPCIISLGTLMKDVLLSTEK